MASQIKGAEPIIGRIQEIFLGEMPAKLAALDAEFCDFALQQIQDVYIGGSDGKSTWPSIAISEEDPTTLAPYSSGQYIAYPIVMGCINLDDGSGFQQLMRSLLRYQRAMMEILHDHKSEPGYWINIQEVKPVADGPWPTAENKDQYAAVKGVRAWFTSTESF